MIFIFWMAEFLSTFIEGFIAYSAFADIFGGKRKCGDRKMDAALSVIGAVMTLFCNHFALFSYLTLVIVAIYLSVSAWALYQVNYITAFSVMSFYLVCLNSFDFFVLTLASYFLNGFQILTQILSGFGIIRAAVITIVNILWVLFYAVLKKYLRRLSVNLKESYLIALLSMGGFCGFIFLSHQAIRAIDGSMPVLWFMMICFYASIIFINYFAMMRKEEKHKVDFLEIRYKLLSENYHSLNEIYKSNAKLYYDLNNHLNLLYQLLQDGNVEEAKGYIKEIANPILVLSKKEWTGIDVVDAVINSKIQEMNERKITMDINVEIPGNTTILSNDLCTVLSNLLDNAIEAVDKLERNRSIRLTMRRANFFLFIRVWNPCSKNRKFGTFPATTKKDAALHGWGLRSVDDVVKRYKGTIECANDNHEFVVNIMLPFDGKKQELPQNKI